MAVALPRNAKPRPLQRGNGEVPSPIILDSGKEARVVVVMLPPMPQPGDRFRFEGQTWVVTHARDHQRGLVARPVKPKAYLH